MKSYSFDLSPLLGSKTGIYRYTYSLCEQLIRATSEFCPKFIAYQEKAPFSATNLAQEMHPELGINPHCADGGSCINLRLLRALCSENEKIASFGSKGLGRSLGKIRREIIRGLYKNSVKLWPERLDKGVLSEVEIYHSPHPSLPSVEERKNLFSTRVQYLLTIHDMIPVVRPDWFSKTTGFLRTLSSVNPSDYVITVSQSTKNDFCNYYPDFDPERVFVTPLGVSDKFRVPEDHADWEAIKERYGIREGGSYYLSLCTLEPRKNLIAIVRAFCNLLEAGKIRGTQLVLVGKIGWRQEQLKELYDFVSKHKEHIIITGFVEDEFLPLIYHQCLAFVFASFYEGFGLPPLEAMACGAPVICSNSSSLPEVTGEAALSFDPYEQEQLQEQMLKVYEDRELRLLLKEKAFRRATLFSWEKTAEATLAVYKKITSVVIVN